MSQFIYQPHDKFFKSAMSDHRVAEQFFDTHLPKNIKELVDFQSLQFHKETFITDELKFQAADVIYSANFAHKLGYLYLLIEQQTKPDKWLPFRIQKYMMKLIDYHHQQYPEADLPIIYPLIFYNGDKVYHYSTDFYELFGGHAALAKEISKKPIQLLDVQKIPDEEMKKHQWSGILEFVFKHQKTREFLNIISEIMVWLHNIELQQGYNYAKTVLQYIISQSESKDLNHLINMAKYHLSPRLGEEAMTVAEAFTLKGFEQGMQQGVQQGMQQGMQQGVQIVAKNLLVEGMSIKKIMQLTGLTLEEINILIEASEVVK